MEWIKTVIANVLDSLPVIIIAVFAVYVLYFVITLDLNKKSELQPKAIESTILRQDNCTVIKTLLTDSQYIFVSVCDITVIGEE